MMPPMAESAAPSRRFPVALLASFLVLLAWSGAFPHDRLIWVLEAAPAVVAAILLCATFRRFRFTNLVYIGIWLHALILIIGAHHTYAREPLFSWIRDTYDLSRNHYDRLGHVAQGFFPALVVRELLLRTSPLRRGKWLFTLVTCACLAVSAFYEILEWWAALVSDEAASTFVGSQGDVWDAQWDMFLALIGAMTAQTLLGRVHDRQLADMEVQSRKA